MARRYNSDYYGRLSPSVVVPNHFSCNQSSTIVIIYEDFVGVLEDQLTFVFPGEVSGGSFKRVIPRRIDSRTFVMETPIYNTLRRGFIYVTPQLKFKSGEIIEMADFKISLKYPVRSVMELCLSLSTQNAVLPVLLTLIMHSRGNTDSSELYQDAHFDRIMATLVGSMDPGTRRIRDIVLPEKKWRKLQLTDFAREFNMQEMEKQAYLLRKRVKEKRKGSKSGNQDDVGLAISDDDDDNDPPPPVPLFHGHLSTSTPSINQLSLMNDDIERNLMEDHLDIRHSTSSSPMWKKKKPPRLPKKRIDSLFATPPLPRSNVSHKLQQRLKSEQQDERVYDPVMFDIGEDSNQIRKSLNDKLLTRQKKCLSPPTISQSLMITRQQKVSSTKQDKQDDTGSLDSYEEMAEDVNLGSYREQDEGPPVPSRNFSRLPPSSDPDSRPQMPLPTVTPSNEPNIHYTLSTKKKTFKLKPPLPKLPEPKEPQPLPPSKRPLPKPANLGSRSAPMEKRRSRRNKDVYIPESESDEDDVVTELNEVSNQQTKKGKTYVNVDETFDIVGDHLYDCPDLPQKKERQGQQKAHVSGESGDSQTNPAATSDRIQYHNIPRHHEPSYEDNPTLSFIPSSNHKNDQMITSGGSSEDRKLFQKNSVPPTPPKKKAGPFLPAKASPTLPKKVFPSTSSKPLPIPPPKGNQKKGGSQFDNQMFELSALLSNRNANKVDQMLSKKAHWKQGEPQIPPTGGGMKSYI